jgi:hypothetical protein
VTSAEAGRSAAARAGVRLLAVLALAMHAAPAAAAARAPRVEPPPRYHFAGVPWLATADSALARLAERGYRDVPEAGDTAQIVCRGRLFDHDALVTGYLDDRRRVVRWVVLVASRGERYKWPDMREVFDQIVRESQNRYGPPRSVVEKFRFPYQRGDGWEDEALRDGKATIRWGWVSRGGDRLAVEMTPAVSVTLTYECQEWAGLEARRRAKRAADL